MLYLRLLNFKEFSKRKYIMNISNNLNISSLCTFTKLLEV